MRSKNIRIVLTGGILTLVTVVALQNRHAERAQAVSSKSEKTNVVAEDVASTERVVTSPAPSAAPESAAVFNYINRPSNAAQIESMLPAASHDIHYVKVDATMTGANSAIAQPGSHVSFALPDGTRVPVVIENAESLGQGQFVSNGRIEGFDGQAVFSVNNGELSANIDSFDLGSWQVRALGGAVSQVFKVDSDLVPPCAESPSTHTSVVGAPATGTVAAAPVSDETEVEGGTTTTSGTFAPGISSSVTVQHTIRVLVPYSAKIRYAASDSAIVSGINLAVATMNVDLARSAIPVKVVLSQAFAVNYNQDGTDTSSVAIDRALTRITSSTDGVLDSVHVMRYHTQSDLVCFLINQTDSTNSGVGYVLRGAGDVFNPTYGFSAITYGYLNSSRTFSHEIGHNFGCNHDRQNTSTTEGTAVTGTYAYSYGYRFYGSNGTQYRTIMAYPPGQVAAYYSNPNLTAASPVSVKVGVPLGNSAQAYNALTITQNATEVSNYHNSSLIKRIAAKLGG